LKGKEKMMSKIGKDECKGKKIKNSFPFIQGDRMDARKKKIMQFPFILFPIWKCVVVPKEKHPTSMK
jgi:hypothetical protein